MTDAATEDAVARAKAIAAKLAMGGGGVGVVDQTHTVTNAGTVPAATVTPAPAAATAAPTERKRKRWGTDESASSTTTPAPAPASSPPAAAAPGSYYGHAAAASHTGSLDASALLASAIPGLTAAGGEGGEKRTRTAPDASKKIWIPTEKNPGYNYVGLLIGPGGSKQRALQAEAGGRVKIAIRGKGTGGQSASDDDEPLHVLLEGDHDCVERAEKLVRELLEDTEKADAEKGRQLASLGVEIDRRGGEVADAAKPVSTYTPKPVAQLIGIGGGGGGGAGLGFGGAGDAPGAGLEEETIGVPNGVVGFIIGRGGESITSMQRRTGCRVQIQKEHEMAPGTNTRIITLTSSDKTSIAECKQIIEDMVAERQKLNGGGGGGIGGSGSGGTTGEEKLQQALASGQQLVQVQVPDADVGLVIGRGGMNIRSIQDRTGAHIQIPQQADPTNPAVRTCSITHPTTEGANAAKQLVEEILRNKFGNQADTTIQVAIPDKDVGMVIGRSGCVIREMQSKTKCKIQIPSQATPGQANRIATVSGSAEGCQQVKQMIDRIIMEQSSQSVMSGAGFTQNFHGQPGMQGGMMQPQMGQQYGQMQQNYGAQYGQQQQGMYGQHYGQQQQPAYGQQQQQYSSQQASSYGQPAQQNAAGQQKTDYSAEWAAYYAAQAAAQQGGTAGAAAPSPAAPTNTGAAAPSPAPAPAPAADSTQQGQQSQATPTDPTAYYNDFWRYASYYGEDAARKYYGAWSPPVGTPNPNGTSGGAPAPAAAAAPAQQGQGQEQGQGQGSGQQAPRDSSQRNVSNLPAWMTNKT